MNKGYCEITNDKVSSVPQSAAHLFTLRIIIFPGLFSGESLHDEQFVVRDHVTEIINLWKLDPFSIHRLV